MGNKVPAWIKGREFELMTDCFKDLIDDKKLKQADLAEVFEISNGQLSKLATGGNNLTIEKLVTLHYEYRVDLNYFVARDTLCDMYMKTDTDETDRFEYLVRNLRIEIENAPKREHDRRIKRLGILVMALMGIETKE